MTVTSRFTEQTALAVVVVAVSWLHGYSRRVSSSPFVRYTIVANELPAVFRAPYTLMGSLTTFHCTLSARTPFTSLRVINAAAASSPKTALDGKATPAFPAQS